MKRVISETKVPVKIWASDLEVEAEQQVRNLAEMPFIFKHVAVMPDAHAGKGSTVGTVIATNGAIIPSAVGVDIGCGMCAVMLPFSASELGDLAALRHSIERNIPVGFESHSGINDSRGKAFNELGELETESKVDIKRAAHQLGTLGGGNHFIEVCQDKEGQAWLMLHSGSRNIGKTLAEVHIEKAKGLMKSYFKELPDPYLAFLAQGTKEFRAYIKDLLWAQKYAAANRKEMMLMALSAISWHVKKCLMPWAVNPSSHLKIVDCHHNYTQMENHFGKNVWITRKGAVSAKAGELGIIPGSMGTKSYIVRGLGNPESFCSCSHGAGRRMSRTKARANFTNEDLAKQTEGVECRKDGGVLDEIPGAYKDIDIVMENQKDLVEPIYELKQLLCIKG